MGPLTSSVWCLAQVLCGWQVSPFSWGTNWRLRFEVEDDALKSDLHVCTQVHSSAICNSQREGTTQGPVMDEWRGKMWSVHTLEAGSACTRKEILTPAVAPRHLEDTVPSEIGRRTGQILGNSICMRFPEQSGHGDRKENGGCRGQGEWGASV